jgi:lipid A ethanolaminephosphotransferase
VKRVIPGLSSRPALPTEGLLLLVAVFFAAVGNPFFWSGVLAGRDPTSPAAWGFAFATAVMLVAIHYVLMAPFATRRTVRPLLVLLLMLSAAASFHAQRYGVLIDPSMVRNVLATDTREASDLLGPDLFGHLVVYGVLPAIAVLWVRIAPCSRGRAVTVRAGSIALALVLGMGALFSVFQDFGPLMRNQKALRYAITPANLVWSLGVVANDGAAGAVAAHEPPDPVTRAAREGRRPTLFVLVVGETARAANWQLNGYGRATTPELAKRDPISFVRARACGTSTDVSLPCMFSPYGRADYDEARIRSTDSLLHVLARAGLKVLWRDNQAGCKGVCSGLDSEDLSRSTVPGLCAEGRCLDGILLHDLDTVLSDGTGDRVLVLHQMGNHGPAYFRRYAPENARWQPACERTELRDCSRESIVNAYDNALLQTDRMLADTIDLLERQRDRFDVAMLYVSDHGESLGEHGLYLHGVPHAIAPKEQTEVPMFWWMPADTAGRLGIDLACLQRRALEPAGHDELYHSVLGLLDVSTSRYRASRDVFAGCRAG